MPPPRAFSSRQPGRFPSTGNQACISWPCRRTWCGSNRSHCPPCVARGSSGGCAPGGSGNGVLAAGHGATRNSADGNLVHGVDGGDGTAGSAAVQQVGVFRHQRALRSEQCAMCILLRIWPLSA
jgi:hypothetical protein